MLKQGLTFDESGISQFMLAVFAALAKLESDIKSERIKAGLEVAKANASKLGRPRDETKRKRVYDLRKRGLTIRRIADKLDMTKAGVYYLLNTS